VLRSLAQGPGRSWLLTSASDPVATKEESANAAELAAATTIAAGARAFRLISVGGFAPAERKGQRVYAKGLVNRTAAEALLNLTALHTLGGNCSP
jgi:hypothetical protein